MNIRTVPPEDPCGVAILEAAAQAGLPTSAFNAGHTVTNGAGWFQINSGADNTRMSSSHAYLHPIIDSRPNLEIRTHCWASKVLFDEQRRAIGVDYLSPDLLTHTTVIARREVVLSAGAIDTPKLLMLSGIGPGEHLQEFAIDVLVDAPGVGSNLDDHVEGIVQWDAPQADDPHLDAVVGDRPVLDLAAGPGPARPDDALRVGAVRHEHRAVGLPDDRERLLPDAERVPRALARHRAPALARLPRPRARGPALLHRSRGPRRAGDALRRAPGAQDRLAAGDGRVGRRASWRPGPDAQSDDEIIDYIHKTHNTVYHPACTARMGPDGDRDAVLDPRLSVRGVQGLRVADGSAMPFLPAINPCITTMMIGEKCAEMMLQDARATTPASTAATGS